MNYMHEEVGTCPPKDNPNGFETPNRPNKYAIW